MPFIAPVTVADPTDLDVLPTNFENELFGNPAVLSWYTADAEYLTTALQVGVTRATTIRDRTPNAKHLTAAFAASFVWDPVNNVDAAIGGATYLRADDSTKGYVSPISPWTTGDHSKVFFYKAATPGAARFMQGATGGGGGHQIQLSTLDRIVANVGATAAQIITRNPAIWNMVIKSWDASTGSVGLLCNTRGFTSSAPSASVCGTTSPTWGSNTGIVTGATCNYRDFAALNVDLRKTANQPLLAIILDYFETFYGINLGV